MNWSDWFLFWKCILCFKFFVPWIDSHGKWWFYFEIKQKTNALHKPFAFPFGVCVNTNGNSTLFRVLSCTDGTVTYFTPQFMVNYALVVIYSVWLVVCNVGNANGIYSHMFLLIKLKIYRNIHSVLCTKTEQHPKFNTHSIVHIKPNHFPL